MSWKLKHNFNSYFNWETMKKDIRANLKIYSNTLKCSILITFLGNKKLSTMQQDVLSHFWGYISKLKSGWNMKKKICCPALELFHCLLLWKTVLLSRSRAFLLSAPYFLLFTPMDNSETTRKKAPNCNKSIDIIWLRVQLWENQQKASTFLGGCFSVW